MNTQQLYQIARQYNAMEREHSPNNNAIDNDNVALYEEQSRQQQQLQQQYIPATTTLGVNANTAATAGFLPQEPQAAFPSATIVQAQALASEVSAVLAATPINGSVESHNHGVGPGSNNKISSIDVESSANKKPKRKKKPKDKPKRPLSAYNIFFRDERATILASIQKPGQNKEDAPPPLTPNQKADDNNDNNLKNPEHQQQGIDTKIKIKQEENDTPETPSNEAKTNTSTSTPTTSNNDSSTKRKREGKKTPHGKISFEELAKVIGNRWKELPADRVAHYKELADQDSERYRKEMEAYSERLKQMRDRVIGFAASIGSASSATKKDDVNAAAGNHAASFAAGNHPMSALPYSNGTNHGGVAGLHTATTTNGMNMSAYGGGMNTDLNHAQQAQAQAQQSPFSNMMTSSAAAAGYFPTAAYPQAAAGNAGMFMGAPTAMAPPGGMNMMKNYPIMMGGGMNMGMNMGMMQPPQPQQNSSYNNGGDASNTAGNGSNSNNNDASITNISANAANNNTTPQMFHLAYAAVPVPATVAAGMPAPYGQNHPAIMSSSPYAGTFGMPGLVSTNNGNPMQMGAGQFMQGGGGFTGSSLGYPQQQQSQSPLQQIMSFPQVNSSSGGGGVGNMQPQLKHDDDGNEGGQSSSSQAMQSNNNGTSNSQGTFIC